MPFKSGMTDSAIDVSRLRTSEISDEQIRQIVREELVEVLNEVGIGRKRACFC